MYKLVLVDDEEEVREGILKKIDWGLYGFEIAGEAENGKVALEIVEKVMPDVVITDIKMPFMDGLELSRNLKENFPTTKIVILTGFDEFEYAQKAIKLNVVEYVLKPLSSNDLIEVLVKLKGRLDEEVAQREDIHALREHYKKSLPILKEKFLTSLITSRMNRHEICEKLCLYHINLKGTRFIASVLSIDPGSLQPVHGESSSNGAAASVFQLPEDWELLKFAVFNISEEIVDKYGLGLAFFHSDHIVLLNAVEEDDGELFIDRLFAALEEICRSVEKYLKCTITVGMGNICNDVADISSSYKSAINALDYRVVLGSNRVIYIKDVEPKRFDRIVFDELKEHSLYSCIKVGTAEEIRTTIAELFRELVDSTTSFKDYQLYLLQILTTILRAAKDLNIEMDQIFGANYNLFVEIDRFKTIQEVMDWLIDVCTRMMGHISKERQDSCKILVNEAKEYIKNHYQECDMTIDRVCKHLHISPTYFSTIFKKETKLTFLNYLTQIRMEAAKELLRSTNMKAFEIAEKVGYSEPNYFSYCFKKNFSISPMEYRNSIGSRG